MAIIRSFSFPETEENLKLLRSYDKLEGNKSLHMARALEYYINSGKCDIHDIFDIDGFLELLDECTDEEWERIYSTVKQLNRIVDNGRRG